MSNNQGYRFEWESAKNGGDIFSVWRFLKGHDNLPDAIKNEADDVITTLKRREIELMEDNPSAYPRCRFMSLVVAGLVNVDELVRRGLITEEAYATAMNMGEFVVQNPIWQKGYVDSELLNQDDITDVYLFGVPSSGKTCMLMGLLGSDYFDYNCTIADGEYGDILSHYRDNHILPPRSISMNICIHGCLRDDKGRKKLINLIEVSGSQLLDEIVNNPERVLSLSALDASVAEMLCNNHSKIFFVLIDPTVKENRYTKIIKSANDDVNMIETIRSYPLAQKTEIKRMMHILCDPHNTEIIKRVNALHFVITKSDMLRHANEDFENCLQNYSDILRIAEEMSRWKGLRINKRSGDEPQIHTFSLGKFYLGGIFDYDPSDSDKLMKVIMGNVGSRDSSWIKKIYKKIARI